jgi:hypothetical protein
MRWLFLALTDSCIQRRRAKKFQTWLIRLVAGPPGKTAFIGEMPGTEKIEEHLRKTMGIKRRAAAASGGEDLRKN